MNRISIGKSSALCRKISLPIIGILTVLSWICFGCSDSNKLIVENYDMPTLNHDVGYIPYDAEVDKEDYIVCDSSNINSGRNRIQYPGGSEQLNEDLFSRYTYKKTYKSFSGYIVVRFLINCNREFDRYRLQTMHLDFSEAEAPYDLVEHVMSLIQEIDGWNIDNPEDSQREYMKFVNLKIEDGRLQHVLL